MSVRRAIVAASCALFPFVATPPANARTCQAAAVDKLQQKEDQARSKAAAEVATFARFATSVNAVNDARAAYATALALAPQDEKLKSEIDALKTRKSKGEPKKDARSQLVDRRTKALAKAAEHLAPVIASYVDADRSDDLARLVSLLRAQSISIDPLLKKYDLVFFEPYYDYRRKKDVDRLKTGWEIVDGAWCDPKKVASLDAEHSAWANAWKIGDEVHEVRTTLPLRTARHILATVTSFRTFLVNYFAGEVDLRAPKMKLPIILTGTRDEMDQRLRESSKGATAPEQAAAFYLSQNRPGNPCFVSFEMRSTNGSTMKVDMEGLRPALLHEVSHQILFEFSKHATDNKRLTTFDPWLVEGIAEFLPNYALVDGIWVLKHPRTIPIGTGAFVEGVFGWCHQHAGSLATIGDFVALPQMRSVDDYHLAGGLVAFFLEGKDREYRNEACQLIETVHQAHESADSFSACFKDVDIKALDAEFRKFCNDLKVDDK